MIPAHNLDRGVTFYRDVLGLKHLFRAPPQMAFFQCGDIRLLVGVPPDGSPQRSSAIYFQVTDMQVVHQTLVDDMRRGREQDAPGRQSACAHEPGARGSCLSLTKRRDPRRMGLGVHNGRY